MLNECATLITTHLKLPWMAEQTLFIIKIKCWYQNLHIALSFTELW